MSVNPSHPIIFIQVQPQNQSRSGSQRSSNGRRISPAVGKLKRRGHRLAKSIKRCCKHCSKAAKDANIPILEDSGNEELSIWERIGAVITFILSIVAALLLCLFLEKETTKNPVEEELMSVDISNGPLPTVEVRLENMFTPEFLNSLERTFATDLNKTGKLDINMEEKICLAYLMGQIMIGKRISKPILTFLNQTKANGIKFVPSSDPDHPAMKTAIALTQNGTVECNEIIQNCRIQGEPINCSEFFIQTYSPRGIGCSFNTIPMTVTERIKSIRAKLSGTFPPMDIRYWKSVDMDEIAFANHKLSYGTLQSQINPGEENGISFEVTNPDGDNSTHFLLSVGNPRDHLTTKVTETKLNHERAHLVNLAVVAEYSTSKFKQYIGREKRKCRFYDEPTAENYVGYTFQRCFSSAAAKKRNCLLVSEIDPGKNATGKLCHPSLIAERWFQIEEQGYRLQGHNECPKSCNDIHYSFIPKSDQLKEYSSNRRSDVHVYFSTDDVIVRVKDLKGFTAEQIGIVLGMLGFCNKITLPRLLKLTALFILYGAAKMWKKTREIIVRRRGLTTTFLPIVG